MWDIDHLCRVTACCRPEHLEAVTRSVNVLRGLTPGILKAQHASVAHCPQGHPYDELNTRIIVTKTWHRVCRVCDKERQKLRRAAKRRSA